MIATCPVSPTTTALALVKTPLSVVSPVVLPVVTSASLLTSASATPMETSHLVIGPPSGVTNLEEEFIMELVDSFYSLKQCLSIVLKGVRTSFESLKTIHNRAIKNIKDIGRAGQVRPLEQLVENFEDVSEWCRLSQSDLAPLVEEELDCLSVQMQQTYAEATRRKQRSRSLIS